MKNTLVSSAMAAAALAACTGGNSGPAEPRVADSAYYEGTVPAADGPGIRYELAMAADTTCGYRITATYIGAEDGKDTSFTAAGRAQEVSRAVDGAMVSATMLVLGPGDTCFLKQKGDSVMTMLGKDMKETAGQYDLRRK